MVVFDTSVLLLALDPGTRSPLDPATGNPVHDAQARVDHLIQTLANEKQTIILPTPVISEILVYAGKAGPAWLDYFNTTSVFRIASFDQKAAIEVALSIRDSLDRGGLRIDATDSAVSRGKVKFDRQIVAIAKAQGADTIYSDDADIIHYSKLAKLRALRTTDLEPPPQDPQQSMDFEDT